MIWREIEVAFDDEATDVVSQKRYFRVLDKYADGTGMGHGKTRTSSFIVAREQPLNIETLQEDLGDIEILDVREFSPRPSEQIIRSPVISMFNWGE